MRQPVGTLSLLVCVSVGAASAQQNPTDQDRAAVAQCLAKAKTTKAAPESCIGVVQEPCLDKPEGQSTYGMRDAQMRGRRLGRAIEQGL